MQCGRVAAVLALSSLVLQSLHFSQVVSIMTVRPSCPIHGSLNRTWSGRGHSCTKTACLFNQPTQWSHIEKKIAKFRAELAAKRLARSMKFYLKLSLETNHNFCPKHSTLDPAIVRHLERYRSILKPNRLLNNHYASSPSTSHQVYNPIKGSASVWVTTSVEY